METAGPLARLPLPRARPRDAGDRIVLGFAVYTLLFLIWLVARPGGEAARTLIADVAFVPPGLVVALLAWRTARHDALAPALRRPWTLLAAALTVWWVGDVAWVVYELVLGEPPFPSAADAAYLAFYPIMMAALLRFPHAPVSRIDRTKFLLDAATVLVGGWMVVWYFVLGPTALAGDSPPLLTALSAAYPIGDLVLIFGGTALVLRVPTGPQRRPLTLLAAGVGAFLAADLGFGYLTLQGTYNGGDWPDALWMLAALLFAAGAHAQRLAADGGGIERDRPPEVYPISPLPYAAVALGYLMVIVAGRGTPPYPLRGLLFGAIAITAVVLARQLTLMRENVRLLSDLHALARTDLLTGVHTRRHFFELAGREFTRARRYRRPLAAIMFDVDHFKAVNDRLGHAAGDEVLRAAGRGILERLRDVDLLGRYGGDEFVALLPECGGEAALKVAERILASLNREKPEPAGTPGSAAGAPGPEIHATISAGVADAEGCADLQALIRRADAALYQAKAAGRACARRYTPSA